MPLTIEHGQAAIAVARSNNEKIGDCATTYAAQASCPSSCAFFNGGGCYAEAGHVYRSTTRVLNLVADAAALTPVDVALEEAAAIGELVEDFWKISGRPMRLHTVGDCRTDEAARIVAAAAERYMDAGGGPVWSYTHAWRIVDRASWGRVSVLASCESAEQVELARARGYATAIVVDEFQTDRLHDLSCRTASVSHHPGNTGSPQRPETLRVTGQRPGSEGAPVTSALILPCPAQTRQGVTCSSCRLCMNDTGLRGRGYSIGFAVHGDAFTVKRARLALSQPSSSGRRVSSRDVAVDYLDRHGRLPGPAELARLAGVNPSSAKQMLARLRAEHTTSRRNAA
jgi:hypothetical protein